MNTIYNVYVEMQDQAQCDRMKQLCVDKGLDYWRNSGAFKFFKNSGNYFEANYGSEFAVYDDVIEDKSQITEAKFIELLKTTK